MLRAYWLGWLGGFAVVIGGARGWNLCGMGGGPLALIGKRGSQLFVASGVRVTSIAAVICFR